MVGRRDTGHRGQGDVRHGTLCVQPFWPPKKHFICGPSKKRNVCRVVPCNQTPSLCTIHAIPQAACRSGAMRLGPVGVDRRRRYLRITILMTPIPSRWSPHPSSSAVSMRWTRGLQTEVLEHMPPCSAPRWLLIAFTLVFAQRTRISQVSQSGAVPWPVGFSGKGGSGRRCFRNINDWLLSSMADNDNFEWVDVLTGGVLAGNDPVASAFCQIQCIVVCACRDPRDIR